MNIHTREDCDTCGSKCTKKRSERQRSDTKCSNFTKSDALQPMKVSIMERLVKANPVATAETLRLAGLKLLDHHQYPYFRLEAVRG